jgi:hypothetical protein
MPFFSSIREVLVSAWGYFFPSTREQADSWSAETRAGQYRINELFYANRIYAMRNDGGLLETICERDLACDCVEGTRVIPVVGVREIVDLYLNVWPGVWGNGMGVADKFDGVDVNAALVKAVRKVWRDSGLDTVKSVGLRLGANLGTCGIRIRATADRVQLDFVHPGDIADFEEDEQGNVKAVLLRYTRPMPEELGEENPRVVEVEERIDTTSFSLTYDGKEQLEGDELVNRFGFCPFVILRHRTSTVSQWGEWAYAGAEPQIHAINWRFSRQDAAIDDNQFPQWFATAGGKKPDSLKVGRSELAYVQSQPDTPPPSLAPLVAQLQHDPILKFTLTLRDMLRGRQPEITFNDIQLLSGVSGESLAQALKPTANAIETVRPNYDHALIRAIQMCISIGGMMGVAGYEGFAGTAEASRLDYLAGKLNFRFIDRPPLPLSPFDKITQTEVDTARRTQDLADATAAAGAGVSQMEVLKIAGYDETTAAKIIADRAAEDAAKAKNEQGARVNKLLGTLK